MADLPKITIANPVVLPASTEKTLSEVFVDRIQIFASQASPWLVKYRWFPHDGHGVSGPARESKIENLQKVAEDRLAAGKPKLAQAVGAIVLALQELLDEETAPPEAPSEGA